MSSTEDFDNAYDIAIVGMSGRFPGARNIEEFWQNLRDGVESISFFSDEEMRAAGVDQETLSEPNYVKASGVLDRAEVFDASFFGFNPREAEVMDPQQRIFMECAWESLEHAGYDPETYRGLIGVYAGASLSSYLFSIYGNPELVGLLGDFQVQLGNDKDNLPTSVSYKLNLKGPSIAVQSTCSTSLVAICVACQSLLNYQCDMALAGGVRIALPQVSGYHYQEGGIMSPDGHCRAFDAQAGGTIGGNGVGIVVLKRLQDAISDGDCIHAVIKGTAINNDGSLKIGYTAPSIEGQAQVVTMAQANGEIDPRTVTYIEAHGTGTDLGDPIEIAALTQAFRAGTEENGFCALGSVKTNVGHLDTAAGVAGLIKTVMALKHKVIPPSLHYVKPNPRIDFENSPFYVNAQLAQWKTNGFPRRAGVNSFGIGGTNAHVIAEEAPPVEPTASSRPEHLLVLSARTDSALETATTNLLEHFKQHPDLNLADAAYTLQVGRRAFARRRMLVCKDLDDALSALETLDPARVFTSKQESIERPVTFMFSGQGAQYVNMARDLYRHEQTFREHVDRCLQLLTPHLGFDLREVLYPRAEQAEEAAARLQQTSLAQPALFVIEYALAQVWIEWGVRPVAMIGHSLGEYVAACLAGVFSLEDALALVAARGRLMQEMPGGAMLVVALPEQEVRSFLNGKLSLAAVNAANLCVVSGPTEAVHELEAELTSKGTPGQRLHTSHAFHSEMMQPVLDSFVEQLKSVRLQPPQMPYVSNLTGTWITATEATDPNYWARHLRQTVRFAEGLEQLISEEGILLEVGPGQTLCTLAKQQNGKSAWQIVLSSLRHPHDAQPDERFLLNTLGRLWLSGVKIDWRGFHKNEKRRRTPLPTYPFEGQRYWVEAQSEAAQHYSAQPEASLEKKPDIADWFYIPSWKRSAPPELFQKDSSTQKSRWLIFKDACGVGTHLSERLESAGKDVLVVTAGEKFAKHGERAYNINPREREDYNALFKELQASDHLPEVIVHLWNVTMDDEAQSELDSFAKFQALGFNSLLFLAQAIGEQSTDANQLKIAVVSNQMQSVTGEETLCPSKATSLGPCKVIPEEYQQIVCRSIDVELPASGIRNDSRLLDQLFAELNAETFDPLVAYRGKHRWVQTFEAVRLSKVAEPAVRLREKGVYLITGGMGGIGLTLAEHLAKTVQAKLVLLGRSHFPVKEEWGSWLATHDENDRVSSKIRKLMEMEETGAEVMVASADVSDREAMQDVVKRATERCGQINGVIHSAGVAGGRIIQLQTPEEASSVLSPKGRGTLVLDALFKNEELDFFVLCSSLNSIHGALGQVDYCGANAFLDAFAHHANSRNRSFAVSVNWDAWQEVGMAVNTIVPRDMEEWRAESLKQGILSAEGVEAWTRILSTNLAQVAVSTTTLPSLTERDRNKPAVSEDEDGAEHPTTLKPLYQRPALNNDYVAPRDEVEENLASIWQKLLGVEQVGINDNFFELGGHSLLALQLISRLREAFQIELTMRHLFDAPTIAQLARSITETRDATHEDIDRIARMVKLVEQLSENEIQAMLSEQRD